MRIGWDWERKGRGRASCSAWEGRAAAGAVSVEVSVGYMSVEVSVVYVSVGWACGRARGRGALGERPSGEGVEWEEREGSASGRGVRVGWALGFGDYLDAGLPVAKSAPNPYTTERQLSERKAVKACQSL
jgi:hypothetical protein